MTDEAKISVTLYQGVPHQCSYLSTETTTLHIIDPQFRMTPAFYSNLLSQGFRRSGDMVYRPGCSNCDACTPARIPVGIFSPNRAQKRCLKNNQDIRIRASSLDTLNETHFDLYSRYLKSRHQDGDMAQHTQTEMEHFLSCSWGNTELIEGWLHDDLVMVAVTDRTPLALSALYTFFAPELEKRSLGTLGILNQIIRCEQLALPFLYLGYWIESCQKMAYKTAYRPLELLQNGHWKMRLPAKY